MSSNESPSPSTVAPSDSASNVRPTFTPSNRARGSARGSRGGRGKGRGTGPAKSAPGSVVSGIPQPTRMGAPPTPLKNDPLFVDKFDYSAYGNLASVTARPKFSLSFAGYIALVYSTWTALVMISPKFRNAVPFALFQYYCVVVLWYRIVYVHVRQGQAPMSYDDNEFINQLSMMTLHLPAPIRYYLAGIGSVTDPSGDTWFNASYTCLGSLSSTVHDGLAGHYGKLTANNFWKYSNVPTPHVVLKFLQQSIIASNNNEEQREWNLPVALMPDVTPNHTNHLTENCLGYHATEDISAKGLETLQGLGFTAMNFPNGINRNQFVVDPATLVHVSEAMRQTTIASFFTIEPFSNQSPDGSIGQMPWLSVHEIEQDVNGFPTVLGNAEAEVKSRFDIGGTISSASFFFMYRRKIEKDDLNERYSPVVQVDQNDNHHVPNGWTLARANTTFSYGNADALNFERFRGISTTRHTGLAIMVNRFVKHPG